MFIYVFEDGYVAKSLKSPSPGDIQSVRDGLLQVFKFEDDDVKAFDSDGKLTEIPSI